MRKIVLEYKEATEVDADYYGMVSINAPILLTSQNENLTDDELIIEYSKIVDIKYVYEALEELEFLYKQNPSDKLKKLNEKLKESNKKLQKVNKSIKDLEDLSLNTSELRRVSSELNNAIRKYKFEIKELEKLEDSFEELLSEKEKVLIRECRNSDFYYLSGTTDIKYFIESDSELDIRNLVLSKYQIEFVEYLIERGWEYVDLSRAVNEVLDEGVNLKELYKEINERLKIK